MKYLSVCSGIEAATVAWHEMGWSPVAFSEIEKFPSEVLAHHYPNTPNLGDMNNYKDWTLNEPIDILVGGTPCQSFSVAGLRKGLDDPRGNLALIYCGILEKFKPQWFVWENVPGVLSSNGGRDFGSFLGAVAELGYGFSYRVLDAQYFGVAQRRKRVFVVGHLGDWRPAAEVLFERESFSRDNPPCRKTWEAPTNFTSTSFGGYSTGTGTLRASGGDLGGGSETLVSTSRMVAFGEYSEDGTASTMKARDYKDATDLITVYETHPADSRVKEMGDTCQTVTSRWGTGGGNVPIAVKTYALQGSMIGRADKNGPQGDGINEDISFTLNTTDRHAVVSIQDVRGLDKKQNGKGWNDTNLSYTVDTHATQGVAHMFKVRGGCEGGGKGYLGQDEQTYTISTMQDQQVFADMRVRRLTPTECERLQGFPDGYSDIMPKGKATSDSSRYKALGNSMAVPVMKWIGARINEVNKEN